MKTLAIALMAGTLNRNGRWQIVAEHGSRLD